MIDICDLASTLGIIFLASRASEHHLDTQTLKNHPSDAQIILRVLSLNVNFRHIIELFLPQCSSHDIVRRLLCLIMPYPKYMLLIVI